MNKKVFSVLGLLAILAFMFAAVNVTTVYAGCGTDPSSPSCKDPTGNSGWVSPGGDTSQTSTCRNGAHSGNPHCDGGGSGPGPGPGPQNPATITRGTGPGSAPVTGSLDPSVAWPLARVGGVFAVFSILLGVSIRRLLKPGE
jgi:hypothetical protein